jgi:hypothetical protein
MITAPAQRRASRNDDCEPMRSVGAGPRVTWLTANMICGTPRRAYGLPAESIR